MRRGIKRPRPQDKNKLRFGIWDGDKMVGVNTITSLGRDKGALGWRVFEIYRGQNYAARSRKPIIDFAFNELHLKKVFCEIVIGNEASRRSVENSGFIHTATKEGKWIYELLKDGGL